MALIDINDDLRDLFEKFRFDLTLLNNDDYNHVSRQREMSNTSELYLDEFIWAEPNHVTVEFSSAVYAIRPNQSKCLIRLTKYFLIRILYYFCFD